MLFTSNDDFYDAPDTWNLPDCAVALLIRAGSWSARNGQGGYVPRAMLGRFTDDPESALAPLLDRGLWDAADDGYLFSDWLTWMARATPVPVAGHVPPDSATIAKALRLRASANRRQALVRNPGLRHAIRTRDADKCRYCGRTVVWGNGRAPDSGTYDHLDPEGKNTLENLVVACRSCNSKKSRRTPEQAGMRLLSPPARAKAAKAPAVTAPDASDATEVPVAS